MATGGGQAQRFDAKKYAAEIDGRALPAGGSIRGLARPRWVLEHDVGFWARRAEMCPRINSLLDRVDMTDMGVVKISNVCNNWWPGMPGACAMNQVNGFRMGTTANVTDNTKSKMWT